MSDFDPKHPHGHMLRDGRKAEAGQPLLTIEQVMEQLDVVASPAVAKAVRRAHDEGRTKATFRTMPAFVLTDLNLEPVLMFRRKP